MTLSRTGLRLIIAVAAIVFRPLPVWSQDAPKTQNGAELLEWCGDPDESPSKAYCLGLIYAVARGRTGMRKLHSGCIPADVNVNQAALVVSKYLRDNPQQLHRPSVDLAAEAIEIAWPCRPRR